MATINKGSVFVWGARLLLRKNYEVIESQPTCDK